MNRRKWFKTIFGAAVATVVPLPELKAAVPTVDPRLPKILIPMIKRTFPELIASEIVGGSTYEWSSWNSVSFDI